MTARERAVEAGSWAETMETGRVGSAVAEAVVAAVEAAGLHMIDSDVVIERVWRAPDRTVVLLVEGSDRDPAEFLPEGAVELHPDGAAIEGQVADVATRLDALATRARGTMPRELDGDEYGRAAEDLAERLLALVGRPLEREPVDQVAQRVETALAAWITDPTRLRAVAGDVLDLAQRTLLGQVEGGHPWPRESAGGRS